jgi:HEPN domain-containing protein
MKKGIENWLFIAERDLQSAKILLSDANCPTDNASFHCQQAIEKYFKAFLLDNGWELKKIHNLETLYNEIKKIKDFQLNESMIQDIYREYSNTRYPCNHEPPTEEQAREFYKFALEVEQKIKKELGVEGMGSYNA